MTDMETGQRILVVDDEKNLCATLAIILGKDGYEVVTALNGAEALEHLGTGPFDLVIQDIRMPGMDGIDLLARIRAAHPALPVVMMTAHADWNTAARAMQLGAFDFISKPFANDTLRSIVRRLLDYRSRPTPSDDQRREIITHLAEIIGNSTVMRDVFSRIESASRTEATVLITGESGVGKELAAQALHQGSLRNGRNFISINCSAFVPNLLENEIFGHVRGAYTGADREKKGLLEVADKGTFFLDEIGDLDIELQGKLLKVVEDREFYPVGSTRKTFVDVRFIAATNQNLEALIGRGRFRQDLFYRINVIPITIPPLRDRREDIPLLAGHFLRKYASRYGKDIDGFMDEAADIMNRYAWPGNVRELENRIQRAILACPGSRIRPEDVGPEAGSRPDSAAVEVLDIPPDFNLDEHVQKVEQAYIIKALADHQYHLTNAANALGMNLRSLRYKIAKYTIDTRRPGS